MDSDVVAVGIALPTPSVTLETVVCVSLVVSVPTRASHDAFSGAREVHGDGDRFEVSDVAAQPHSAEVIDGPTFCRSRAVVEFVGQSVSLDRSTVALTTRCRDVGTAVPLRQGRSGPDQAVFDEAEPNTPVLRYRLWCDAFTQDLRRWSHCRLHPMAGQVVQAGERGGDWYQRAASAAAFGDQWIAELLNSAVVDLAHPPADSVAFAAFNAAETDVHAWAANNSPILRNPLRDRSKRHPTDLWDRNCAHMRPRCFSGVFARVASPVSRLAVAQGVWATLRQRDDVIDNRRKRVVGTA
ncbi:hypothetical protein A2J03_15450 [Rhodococcus sp. EPR-157]|nr:hypothetical protein A2J03_15450 [Rhodococcus sp. EPR-157]